MIPKLYRFRWMTLCISILAVTALIGISFTNLQAQCDAAAGTLGTPQICLADGKTIVSATPNNDQSVPDGFTTLYVLTSGAELIIQQVSPQAAFELEPVGSYTIHTLVYDPTTLDLSIVEPGVTTGFDVNSLLEQGGGTICAALDVPGAKFAFDACPVLCNASAGTLTVTAQECTDDGRAILEAESVIPPFVPAGYQVAYVLTMGEDLVIMNTNDNPTFEVENEGIYTIHTLVFDPSTLDLSIVEPGVTTGFDVNGLLVQGGGSICAALDVAGAQFDFKACAPLCEVGAGTLIVRSQNCNQRGEGVLRARRDEAPIVPGGYSVIYVLTKGDGLVIQATNNRPSFSVTEPGLYTIHTLVFDPTTLDLSIVEPGVTTGFDVNSLLVQGGGAICAALDVTGARFEFEGCEEDCLADAGTLSAESKECFDGQGAEIEAEVKTAPTVPSGYGVIYVLTKGDELVILDTNEEPEFTVPSEGIYTIHTLVFDPTTLDLSIVKPGITTGFDVNSLLIQGGGTICAALDVSGARFKVVGCDCEVDAGTLRAQEVDCYYGYNWIKLEAYHSRFPVVPFGYERLYVITTGDDLVLRAASKKPEFFVKGTGKATIHTLVYNPETLDLSIVQAGVTTGVDINKLLIQGGGSICAALDVAGAPFEVQNCDNHVQGAGLRNGSTAFTEVTAEMPPVTGQLEPRVFPNPVNDQLQISIPAELSTDQRIELEIFNATGQRVAFRILEAGETNVNLDVSNLPGGWYSIRFNLGNGQVNQQRFTRLQR